MSDIPKQTEGWSPDVALAAAHDLICSVGFELKYTSPSGSRYYHLAGRRGGMLRLASHSVERPAGCATMLTIHMLHMPRSEHKLRRMVAETIGWYFLNTIAIDERSEAA